MLLTLDQTAAVRQSPGHGVKIWKCGAGNLGSGPLVVARPAGFDYKEHRMPVWAWGTPPVNATLR